MPETCKVTSTIWLTNMGDFAVGAQPHLYMTDADMSGQGWVKVREVELDVEPPELLGLVEIAIANARKAQASIRAEAESRIRYFDTLISKFQSLTYSQSAVKEVK